MSFEVYRLRNELEDLNTRLGILKAWKDSDSEAVDVMLPELEKEIEKITKKIEAKELELEYASI